MAKEKKTLSAPLALIKANVGGSLKVIGKMRDVRVTETFRREKTKGIGELFPKENNVVDWAGTLSCSSFFVDLIEAGINVPNRKTNDPVKFANTILLDEDGIDVYLYRKIKNVTNETTGIVETIAEELIAPIRMAFIERDSFHITENQLSGRDQEFTYNTPILINPL